MKSAINKIIIAIIINWKFFLSNPNLYKLPSNNIHGLYVVNILLSIFKAVLKLFALKNIHVKSINANVTTILYILWLAVSLFKCNFSTMQSLSPFSLSPII